jgi:cytochrome P450
MRLDPFSIEYNTRPAGTWRRILTSGQRVGYDDQLQAWLIAGHANVRNVLANSDRFSNAGTLFPVMPVSAPAGAVLAGLTAPPVLVTADPPQHQRIRRIVRDFFPNNPAMAERRWGALVTARVDELIAELAGHTEVDLMDLAVWLPLQVVADVLGLPIGTDPLRTWTDQFATLVWGNPSPEQQLAAAHGAVALWEYCRSVVTGHAAGGNPGRGLIGDLLAYRDGDDARLTLDEVAAIVLNIFGAGWETVSAALGHALVHGLREPARWARLAHDEFYLADLVEETLRHSPAIDGWLRLTRDEVVVDGVTIPAGARCLVLIGTAGHDPAVFPDPQAFEPGRARWHQHLAFGTGPHYCLGAALARLELATALRALARRLPQLTLEGGHQRRFKPSAGLRQDTTLPASAGAAGRCPVAHPGTPGGQR